MKLFIIQMLVFRLQSIRIKENEIFFDFYPKFSDIVNSSYNQDKKNS